MKHHSKNLIPLHFKLLEKTIVINKKYYIWFYNINTIISEPNFQKLITGLLLLYCVNNLLFI